MKSVLLVHTRMQPHGGGQTVGAWTIQALKDVVDLTVLSWRPPDVEGVNRFFGTSISAGDFKSEWMPPPWSLMDEDPWAPLQLLKRALMQRRVRRLDRRHRYDVLLSTDDEMDFGRRGIQYVHYPYLLHLAPREEWRWYQRVPGLVRGYWALCLRLGDWSPERLRTNLTLVNSNFIAGKVSEVHGLRAVTVFPPVPGGFPEVAWENREPGFAFIGRLQPSKRVLETLEILDGVRRRGHEVRLVIFATREVPAYLDHVKREVERRASWVDLHLELPREQMVRIIARQRYGILAKHREHFGIAVAELLRAGCIPFVHDSGGCREIVGEQPLLRFADDEDAVAKIDRVLESVTLQQELRTALGERRQLFSEERFMEEMRRVVLAFPPSGEG